MQYTLWIEGFAATGESGQAQDLGVWEGENLDAAIMNWVNSNSERDISIYYRYNEQTGYHLWWGCRIFDNESDARRSFG